MAQTELAIGRFRGAFPGRDVEVRIISTEGDVDKTSPLTEIGGRGVFTNAIECAILRGDVDAAVHSAKDLPTVLHPAAPIVAFPDRDDPRDVLVSRHRTTLDRLPPDPVIGTSSRRRDVQLLRLRPDARIVNIRGNIDTRLRKAEGPELDAIVLAAAGIHRLGWSDRISEYFPVEQMVPSPAQGAIAVQAIAESDAANMLRMTDDPAVSAPVGIERAFLAAVGAGCTFPAGAYAVSSDSGFRLIAMLASESGDRIAYADEPIPAGDAGDHAAELADRLRADVEMNADVRAWNGWTSSVHDLLGARVVVTRPTRQAGPLIAALAERGAKPLSLPAIRVEPIAETSRLDAALQDACDGRFDWIVFTSANAVGVVAQRMEVRGVGSEQLADVQVAVVGQATSAAAVAVGFSIALMPETATAEALSTELGATARSGDRVLYPRSAIGRDSLPDALRTSGLEVVTVEAYRTLPEPDVDPQVLAKVQRGEVDLVTFASPSSVRNLLNLLREDVAVLKTISVVCAGPATGDAARELGFSNVAVSDGPDEAAMTEAIARSWQRRNSVPSPLSESTLTRREATAYAPGRSAG